VGCGREEEAINQVTIKPPRVVLCVRLWCPLASLYSAMTTLLVIQILDERLMYYPDSSRQPGEHNDCGSYLGGTRDVPSAPDSMPALDPEKPCCKLTMSLTATHTSLTRGRRAPMPTSPRKSWCGAPYDGVSDLLGRHQGWEIQKEPSR
jgi:hypothetical protein